MRDLCGRLAVVLLLVLLVLLRGTGVAHCPHHWTRVPRLILRFALRGRDFIGKEIQTKSARALGHASNAGAGFGVGVGAVGAWDSGSAFTLPLAPGSACGIESLGFRVVPYKVRNEMLVLVLVRMLVLVLVLLLCGAPVAHPPTIGLACRAWSQASSRS